MANVPEREVTIIQGIHDECILTGVSSLRELENAELGRDFLECFFANAFGKPSMGALYMQQRLNRATHTESDRPQDESVRPSENRESDRPDSGG